MSAGPNYNLVLPFGFSSTLSQYGQQDYANYTGGVYIYTDFMGDLPVTEISSGTGTGGFLPQTPGGGSAPTIIGGYTAADLAQRPGLIYAVCCTTASTSYGAIYVCGTGNQNQGFMVVPSTPTVISTIYFCTPKTLSTAADQYIYNVGPFLQSVGTITNGIFLSYTDNVNSGRFQVQEAYGSTWATAQNTTFAPAANTWYKLQTTFYGNNITLSISTANGAPTQLYTGASVELSLARPLAISLAGTGCQRVAYTSITYLGGLIDAASLYVPVLTRT